MLSLTVLNLKKVWHNIYNVFLGKTETEGILDQVCVHVVYVYKILFAKEIPGMNFWSWRS